MIITSKPAKGRKEESTEYLIKSVKTMGKKTNMKQRKRRTEQEETKLSFTDNMVGYMEYSRD